MRPSDAGFERHPHSMLRPQRDDRINGDLLTLGQVQSPASPDRREHQHALHPRKLLADTDPGSSTEWEIGIAPSFFIFLEPSLWSKRLRRLPEPRIAMQQVLTEK